MRSGSAARACNPALAAPALGPAGLSHLKEGPQCAAAARLTDQSIGWGRVNKAQAQSPVGCCLQPFSSLPRAAPPSDFCKKWPVISDRGRNYSKAERFLLFFLETSGRGIEGRENRGFAVWRGDPCCHGNGSRGAARGSGCVEAGK